MDVIVGFGPIHDPLLAAALRGCGTRATAAASPGAEALALGRALLPRGHPCSVYYLAGAMVLHARGHPSGGEGTRFVVPGDRCGGYATDLRRALGAAGHAGASVVTLCPERASRVWADLGADAPRAGHGLAEAVAAADALVVVGSTMRTRGCDPATADARIASVRAEVEGALEGGSPVAAALGPRRIALRPPRPGSTPRARVRITGDLLLSRHDGDPGAGLIRGMEARGVVVETPSLAEWIVYAGWRGGLAEASMGRLREALDAARRRCAEALGVPLPAPVDVTHWVEAVDRWLPLGLCTGSAILELATYFEVDASRRADLVISLKPFASIPSSAASDAVLQGLSQSRPTSFLSLELHGDMATQLESRVDLALRAAAFSAETTA